MGLTFPWEAQPRNKSIKSFQTTSGSWGCASAYLKRGKRQLQNNSLAECPLKRGSGNDLALSEPQLSTLPSAHLWHIEKQTEGNTREFENGSNFKGPASSFACSGHLQAKVIIANCLMFACWIRGGKPKVDPVGGHARFLLFFCLLCVMFSGAWGTSSSCSQPRCFQWKIFFFFLVTFALIFIRKPVCGLPWSITPLFTPWVKNVYRPRRSVCVSSLMNWAPTSATLGSGMETSPLFRLLSSPISFFLPRLSDF